MSGTHSHTAQAQADVQRAEAQGGRPNVPPGHLEADRPAVRRAGPGAFRPVIVGVLAVAAIAAGAGLAWVAL